MLVQVAVVVASSVGQMDYERSTPSGRSAPTKRSRYDDGWKEVVSVCRTSSDTSTSGSRAKSKDGVCASSDDDGWEGVATVGRTTPARSTSSVAEDRNDEDGLSSQNGDDDVRSSGIVEDPDRKIVG